jgi:very-short-patch-repair endonuclease
VPTASGMDDRRFGVRNTRSKKPLRQNLRSYGTAAEAVLWKSLQNRQLLGKKFRRQHSIGRYIVDFYCPESCLIVELDGEAHYSPTIEEYEARRTEFLEALGLTIIRFENRELRENLDGVLEAIKERLQAR